MKRSAELTEAISNLINTQPFFAVLLFELMKLTEQGRFPTACTDGKSIDVNPKWFGPLPIKERVFVLCHEVLHTILHHVPRLRQWIDTGLGPDGEPVDFALLNQAADAVINDWLIESGVGSMPAGANQGVHHPGVITYEHTVDEAYCILKKRQPPQPPQSGGGGAGEGDGEQGQGDPGAQPRDKGFDQHLMQGESSHQQLSDEEVQRAVQSAAAAAKTQGDLPAALKRLVDDVCEPQVNWREQLQLLVQTHAGRDEATWRRPNKRRLAVAPQIYLPGRHSHRAGCIVMYGDTSGSISDQEWSHFKGEMAAIVEMLNPEECFIGSCDTEAHPPHVVEAADDVRLYEPEGGGGTHMPAIFDRVEREGIQPDVLVILTDGYTDFGEQPPYPVVWVMTTDQSAPFGSNLRIRIGE